MAFDELHEYTQNFRNIEGKKPENEREFIIHFIEFLKDEGVVAQPDGEGAYFGKQCIVEYDPCIPVRYPRFEIAFDNESMVIYTANHDGYWVAPYVSAKRGDGIYEAIAHLLRAKLIAYTGVYLL